MLFARDWGRLGAAARTGLVALVAALEVGCKKAPEPHPWQPLEPGTVWEYDTSIERVVSVEQRSGRVIARVLSDPLADGASSERAVVLVSEGISAEVPFFTSPVGESKTTEASGLVLPRNPQPGERWSWQQVYETPISTMRMRHDAEAVAMETVSVRAGTFEALRVHVNFTNQMLVKNSADKTASSQDETYWYARGVGLVKYESVATSGYASRFELVRFRH